MKQNDDLRYSRLSDIISVVLKMQEKPEGLSISEIADEIASTRRTAERVRNFILRNFSQIGEIENNGRYKKWGVINFSAQRRLILNLISFSNTEILELDKLRKEAKRKCNSETEKTLDLLIKKIKTVLKKSKFDQEDEITSLMEYEGYAVRRYYKQNYDKSILKIIREALISHKKVSFEYTNRNYEHSTRTVEPYGILYDEKTYLLAKDGILKFFELTFIENIKIEDVDFVQDKDFDLEKYTNTAFGVFQENPITVKINFNKQAAREIKNYVFHPTQQIFENEDGSVTVEFTACGKISMCKEFFKWGNKVKILEPQELKDIYRNELQKALSTLC